MGTHNKTKHRKAKKREKHLICSKKLTQQIIKRIHLFHKMDLDKKLYQKNYSQKSARKTEKLGRKHELVKTINIIKKYSLNFNFFQIKKHKTDFQMIKGSHILTETFTAAINLNKTQCWKNH